MARKKTAPGAAPYLQGYWSRIWGIYSEPPKWHEGHLAEDWRVEWIRGWMEADNRAKE